MHLWGKVMIQMNQDDMLAIVRKQLTHQRYVHTLGVLQSAIELAEAYGVDTKQAETAAIFHDYAKFRDLDEMKSIIENEVSIPNDLLHNHHELWHAFVGAYLVEKEVGIKDEAVLDAIRYHTTGRAEMTVLDKVVFLADYIEPGRRFRGVDEVRLLAQTSLNQAVCVALQNTIQFLQSKNVPVYHLTLEAYNDIKQAFKEEKNGD